ncbi:NaeI family type II restriction endonuclease [Demequina sp. NBRC 110052]|uniref:NaeI family type II restriction endonuclease n=1 Tax=Demequina sp. NBRC 110052 TaxID=1570341 RepID=UPI00190ECB3F|nr:NaeI family type II restriction endonuclease [Demequina sp. NBRC 110052]
MEPDKKLENVAAELLAADPSGEKLGAVFRDAFDYLYDGQRTGHYRPDQLSKTEKTHCGSLVEIYLRRALDGTIHDGALLDYEIAGVDVDCKFSFTRGSWMIPPEAFGEVLLVTHADDLVGEWSLGLVRATPDLLRAGANRDGKTGLNSLGRNAITWLFNRAPLPPNALLALPESDVAAIFAARSGQARVNELFRRAQLIPISRAVVATVAQQDDYMKRVRSNGGARSHLQTEGILIAGGDYEVHRRIALDLGAPDVGPGEFVSMRVLEASPSDLQTVELDGRRWRIALPGESSRAAAPTLPTTRRRT